MNIISTIHTYYSHILKFLFTYGSAGLSIGLGVVLTIIMLIFKKARNKIKDLILSKDFKVILISFLFVTSISYFLLRIFHDQVGVAPTTSEMTIYILILTILITLPRFDNK